MRVPPSHCAREGVANYTIMLMLMATRKMNQIMLRAAAQDYSLPGKMGRDLSGCTVGVIGAGKIGRTVLRHLAGFGCRRLAYDLYPSEEPGVEFVPLDTLLAESDVISLHLNATPENYHLIDAAAIAKMKRGALLINTARGTLIDPEALVAGLESGQIGGAGLDVVEEETDICYYNRCGEPNANRELALLRSFPNVIVSPHTAFYTDVNVASMVESAFEATAHFAAGETEPNEVAL